MYIFYTIEHGNRDSLIAGRIYADRMLTPAKVEGKPKPILTHHKWQEGPFILCRNAKYYLTYSCGAWTNSTYHVRYATSDNILGPYTEHPDTLLKSNSMVKGPGHHAIFTDLNKKDWIVYHGWDSAHTARYPRIDRLFVTPKELSSDGPTFTPQSINR
jgi:beta-xylosidase